MISHPFLTGLLVGFSLITAFGAQNIFVLNHGLMRLYVFPIVLFCSLADFTLIWLGIAGIDYFEDSAIYTENDVNRFIEGINILEEIGNHNEFQKYVGDMIHPNIDIRKDDKLLKKWLHGKMVTGHHSSGTCKMGNDPLAVVDQSGSVIGAQNLKVVDASIMPDCIRANTNATVMLIAERIIDLW